MVIAKWNGMFSLSSAAAVPWQANNDFDLISLDMCPISVQYAHLARHPHLQGRIAIETSFVAESFPTQQSVLFAISIPTTC